MAQYKILHIWVRVACNIQTSVLVIVRKKRRFGPPRLAVRHTAQSRSKSVLYDECSTGGAFDPPTQRTINTHIYKWVAHLPHNAVHSLLVCITGIYRYVQK